MLRSPVEPTTLTFRDGGNHEILWETEDLYLFEDERDGMLVKKLNVGFELGRWPSWLELVLPPVKVNDVLYEIPILIFERITDSTFRFFN